MNDIEKKEYTYHLNGMHCNSCAILTEEEISKLPEIYSVKVNFAKQIVKITGSFLNKTDEDIINILNETLKNHGYSVSSEKKDINRNWNEFKIAIPITLVFIGIFILLQKIGLVNVVNASKINFGTSFIIGVIASLSTCMAIVGGLVLSMSASFAHEGKKTRPQIYFHLGRLISFFVLGGVIGALGSVFTLNTQMTFILGIVVGLVMLIMGINLLNVFNSTKKLQISTPKSLSRGVLNLTKLNSTLTPILIGIATFFLPCGFTQSMQIYTLSTGNFLSGAMTMFAFALGTFPVLALLSFSSFAIQKNSNSGIFFKSAGLIVILFAIMNILNSLVVINVIKPIFNL